MSFDSKFRSRPRRWFVQPVAIGLSLMAAAVIFWIFPRLLLFILLLPLLAAGVGLTLYGLDLWQGVPDWRGKITRLLERFLPGVFDR